MADSPIALPTHTLARLEELAHELSNTVGGTMNHLILASTGPQELAVPRLEVAVENAMRATGTVQILMWELAALRRQTFR